jgi:hypothetical protein
MEKIIKTLILKSNLLIVCEIEELFSDPSEPDCKLINPYQYINGDLVKWPETTDQTEILIRSNDILTIVDSNTEIISKYLELTA